MHKEIFYFKDVEKITWDIKINCFTSAFHKISAVILYSINKVWSTQIKILMASFRVLCFCVLVLQVSSEMQRAAVISQLILIINEFSWYCF